MFRSTTIIRELQCPCQSYYYLNTVVCMLIVVVLLVLWTTSHRTSKNTHTWDAPQAQTDPNNMICCHTTTLSSMQLWFK